MKINDKKYKINRIPIDKNMKRIISNIFIHGDIIIYRGITFLFHSSGYKYNEWFSIEQINPQEINETKMKIPKTLNGYPIKIESTT